jgi:predicted nucleic acid-binding protein
MAVAAIAFTRGLTVVTRNVRDFARFEALDVEQWSGRR